MSQMQMEVTAGAYYALLAECAARGWPVHIGSASISRPPAFDPGTRIERVEIAVAVDVPLHAWPDDPPEYRPMFVATLRQDTTRRDRRQTGGPQMMLPEAPVSTYTIHAGAVPPDVLLAVDDRNGLVHPGRYTVEGFASCGYPNPPNPENDADDL